MKYNIIEIVQSDFPNIKNYINKNNSTLNKKPNLLLIDESEIQNPQLLLSSIKETTVPIIITSTDLFLKDILNFKIEKLQSENIIQATNQILEKESIFYENRIICKIAEQCNFDMRAVINYLQLFSQRKINLGEISLEKFTNLNIFKICNKICKSRLKMYDLCSIYDSKIGRLCLNSFMEQSTDLKGLVKTLAAFSDSEVIPRNYEFTSLEHISSHDFVYKKEQAVENYSSSINFDYMWFMPLYKRNMKNRKCIEHLQEIFNFYKIKTLNEQDEEIKNFKATSILDVKIFKYKFNRGSSNAVKRDVSLREIHEM